MSDTAVRILLRCLIIVIIMVFCVVVAIYKKNTYILHKVFIEIILVSLLTAPLNDLYDLIMESFENSIDVGPPTSTPSPKPTPTSDTSLDFSTITPSNDTPSTITPSNDAPSTIIPSNNTPSILTPSNTPEPPTREFEDYVSYYSDGKNKYSSPEYGFDVILPDGYICKSYYSVPQGSQEEIELQYDLDMKLDIIFADT